jgi:hypothetical protein
LVLLIWIAGGALSGVAHATLDYSEYARLLQEYVRPDGVRYAAWAQQAEDRAALAAVLDQMAQVAVSELSPAGQQAFYINLYNAAMLQAVFEHYPLNSVRNIGLIPFSIFKKKFIRLGDQSLSLDGVEKGILLQEYFDPRIHFAVNCASQSCPPLRAEPFIASRLEAQLEQQTVAFANSPRAAQVDADQRAVAYSELLKWYADDFPGEHPAKYLNAYRSKKISTEYTVRWIPYDWSLNELSPIQ